MTDQDNPTRNAKLTVATGTGSYDVDLGDAPMRAPGQVETAHTEHFQQGADVIRAVNAWCFERGMYVVAIGRVAHHDRYHCRVQPAYGADVLCVESDTLAGLLERLNRWHLSSKPHG